MLERYSATIKRSAVGVACKSLKVTSNYYQPHKKLAGEALHQFFVPLTNLRKLEIDNAQLANAFVAHLEKSTATPFPHLETLALKPAESEPIAVLPLRKLTSLKYMILSLMCPADVSARRDEVETTSFPKLECVSLAIREGDLSDITRIIKSAPTLDTLSIKHYSANEAYGALLGAAAKLGTVKKLTLAGVRSSASWKVPKQLKEFTVLTDLTLSTGCTARDAPTFKLLRRLPLQSLRFGSGTIVSDSHLLALIAGVEKLDSLQSVVLNNVYARCDDVQQWDWRRDIDALYDWLKEGYTKPHWTKTFSRAGCQALIDAAAAEGIELSGDAVEAIDIEDEISTNKYDVEGFLERQRRRDRREARGYGWRW